MYSKGFFVFLSYSTVDEGYGVTSDYQDSRIPVNSCIDTLIGGGKV